MRRDLQNREELLKKPMIFCTECDAQLENFCFSHGADDIESVKKTLAQCRKNGRLVGDFCSKLFIADGKDLDDFFR
jgi:hypothetical protein